LLLFYLFHEQLPKCFLTVTLQQSNT
jgi:hypothetical protein